MIKKLRQQGNSQVLPIDKSIMETMGIDMDSELQVTVSGNTLVVTPVHPKVTKADLDNSIQTMRARYDTTLKNLAK